ncbi:MAG: hypothetical protein IKR05_12985 [Prevotella sp.]|nr:hypothetical protein [Prevotella sp.]MBR6264114.1 hypothetical protein [Prevotella sp.]
MKKYIKPITEIIAVSVEPIMELGLSNGKGEGELSNSNTFEEDVSAEYDNSKSLWDE